MPLSITEPLERDCRVDIDHLREFIYLAETLSFQVTAKHFYISQSVLSKHISSMEREVGTRPFDRGRHHVLLTEAGSMFYLDMLKVLNDYGRGLAHLEELRGGGDFSLSVGYLRNAARPFLGTFLNYIEEKHPDARTDITSMEFGELIRAHRSHRIDVGLTMHFDPEADVACDVFDVYRDELYLITAKDHPLASRGGEVSREDLEDLDFVLPDSDWYPGFSDFVRELLPEGCPESSISHYRDVDTLFYKVESGKHVGFSSGHNIKIVSDRLSFLPIGYADTGYDVSAMWLKTMDPQVVSVCTEAPEVCRRRLAS